MDNKTIKRYNEFYKLFFIIACQPASCKEVVEDLYEIWIILRQELPVTMLWENKIKNLHKSLRREDASKISNIHIRTSMF